MYDTFDNLSIIGCLTTTVGGLFSKYTNKIPKNIIIVKLKILSFNIK
jgi:hypothetical protein